MKYEAKLLEDGRGKVVDDKGAALATTYVVDGKSGHRLASHLAELLSAKPLPPESDEADE